ncbi:hypothetical protein [Ilyobacter sp.]|uniref:hypothetical protein n=1 Tax=Ilyobacter sp. TaxID=3100343 RepID=UPI00356709DE
MKKEIKSNIEKLLIRESQLENPEVQDLIAAGAEVEIISEEKWSEMILKANVLMEEEEKKEYKN